MSKLSEEDIKKLLKAFKETGTIAGTVRQTGFSRNTVRRHLRRPSGSLPPKAICRTSKLDPYKSKIAFLVKEKDLSAVRVLEDIKELGYSGGYSILKDHIRTIRPRPFKQPRPPIDHPPGYEAQMDWSPHRVILGGKEVVVHTASFVLCYSRWIFFRHFMNEQLDSVIRFHEEAFHELGAVPEIITYDNMTTVGFHKGPGKPWINPAFERFAMEYDFKPVILQPGKKERHGKVERPFAYIENNFLKGREFTDLEDLNQKADAWRGSTANIRIHGTTRERPVDRLLRERSLLKPLPQNRVETFFTEVDRLVHVDFCVAVNTSRYSVTPNLVGHRVTVRLYRDRLEIWHKEHHECTHEYAGEQHKRKVLPEHEDIYKTMTGQRPVLKELFLRLGETAMDFYEGLKKQRRGAAGYHIQRILKYVNRYGSDVVAGALAHAARYDAYGADAVLRIIQGKRITTGSGKPAKKIPDNVRDYLRTCDVEDVDENYFDDLVNREEK